MSLFPARWQQMAFQSGAIEAFHLSGMRVFHMCKSESLAGVNPIQL